MTSERPITHEEHLLGARPEYLRDDGDEIAWDDPKIGYITERCRGRSVLDLGCVQHDARMARSRYWLHKAISAVASELVGLDLSSDGVERLRADGYTVVHGDAQAFSLEKTDFEVVVAGDIIEHLANPGGMLDASLNHLHDDGRLLVCTPNPFHWTRFARGVAGEVPVNGEHTCWFCPQTLTQLANRHGFDVVGVEYGTQRAALARVPLPDRLRHESFYCELRPRVD